MSRGSNGEHALTAAQLAALPPTSNTSSSSHARSSNAAAVAAAATVLPEQARKVFVGGLAPSVSAGSPVPYMCASPLNLKL